MEYTRLGRSGLEVSRFALGTTNFGKYVVEADAHRLLDRALERGINLIDTANSYGGPDGRGWSESMIGRWLAQGGGRRERAILATKVGFTMGQGPNSDHGLSAYKIRREIQASLVRLQTGHIDLYQMHHIDRHVGWEELWGVMEALVSEGKMRYAGSSNFPAWAIADAQSHARARDFPGIVSEQHWYSLARRQPELEVLPCCRSLGVGVIVYSPLAAGALAGRALAPVEGGRTARPIVQVEVERRRAEVEAYEAFCGRLGQPPAAVALAWVARHPAVTTVLLGPRTMEQLDGSLDALELKLDDGAMAALDRIFPGPGGAAPEAYAW
jgi:aryl-alcohol dehydrogenase-like predicted oxidoreductase